MSHLKIGFAHLIQRLAAVFTLALPATGLREGSDEIVTSVNGYPDAEVSSLSIALYQMGLCKHLPDSPSAPALPHIG